MSLVGTTERLLEAALAVAQRRGLALVGIELRLGARAKSTPKRLRDAFVREVHRRRLSPIALTIEVDPRQPGTVDVVGVALGEAQGPACAPESPR